VLSQLFNFLFFRLWGRLADRVSNKSVLLFTGPVFVFSLLLWPLTSMDNFAVTIAVLVAFHVIAGIANAGIMLAANNLTYKTAPRGKATSYLALNIVVQGIAATIAPILAGIIADALDSHHLVLSLSWVYRGQETAAYGPPPLDLHGIDFLFLLAFLFGLYALHRLLAVREEGEMPEEMVRREFFSEMERKMRQVSTVPGLRIFSNVSISVLGRVLGTRDNPAARAPEPADASLGDP
jgi:MFS family permease